MHYVQQIIARIMKYFTALKIPNDIVVILCDDQKARGRKVSVLRTCLRDLFTKKFKSRSSPK